MVVRDIPESYVDLVREQRELLRPLVDQARVAAKAHDRAGLRATAAEILLRIERGDYELLGNLKPHVGDIVAELDELYDASFPVGRPDDVTDLLAAPWPTARRKALLAEFLGRDVWQHLFLDEVAEKAIAAADIRLLRVLVFTPLGALRRKTVARILDALHQSGALDAAVVERAFADDRRLGYAITGRSPLDEDATSSPLGCADAVRDHVDALTWRLVSAPTPAAWREFPDGLAPRGLRFVQAALAWRGDARVAGHLGAAELTDEERADLLDLLRDRPVEEQRRVFRWRLGVGDADALLPLFGLESAARLLRLLCAMPAGAVTRQDRAVILGAIEEAGADAAQQLLAFVPNELVSAVMGWNRAEVLTRFKRNALQGIAAFGLLPLAPDETVLDRYLVLRESAKKGPKLGPNRRHSHAAAIEVALDHLAQVAGFEDASRLEWDCEARIATETPMEAEVGDYRIALRFDGADPALTVNRGSKVLKSVPAAVRADPGYRELRENQKRLQDQARRMRTGLVERLVATAGALAPDELARLLSLPAGAAMLPALLWRDRNDVIGLLDQVDTTGPVTAVHPLELHERQVLADWQEQIVRRRLRQPVKQVFRELYVLTPAELAAGEVSRRFAGQKVNGKVAGQLLSGRGWSTHGEHADHQATRDVGDGLTAALRCEFDGYFGMGAVLVGELRFLTGAHRRVGGTPVPLGDVPPVVLSEVMRDLDLVVSVAGIEPDAELSEAQAASRAQLLAALIADLGLDRVTVEGRVAVVRGTRATYRVHLTSGSIHVQPGGHLCVVPASFGATAHRRLFLPFSDEDRMTSVVLSKVLLLAEDEKISDPSILSQLDSLTAEPST
ncbi:protein of unknown function [Saccharopolyspora antimicrobica]|uniref:Uncharacterized protein DUF4132 n=1 Tax=Saccharopolyspora antimicrobica TaxID=455193 RepID=A0A1I5ACC6_9PSEU|nr:DUF4132 domain-containing protein [Saccharopolyspora antimicrobica]RKT83194.1 uncharacterized protein DUF4132 [Saccharopolyspora antimicrobica]SFN60020.1 protein of unknown function [Saccharopolyspora antimicrobica]